MAYVARDIKDRIAVGDDCFVMEALGDGRHRLIPSPDRVVESGTPVNRELLQLMEERIVFLMNMLGYGVSANPILVTLDTLDGVEFAQGVWNPDARRFEC